jgi:hypothetical protein
MLIQKATRRPFHPIQTVRLSIYRKTRSRGWICAHSTTIFSCVFFDKKSLQLLNSFCFLVICDRLSVQEFYSNFMASSNGWQREWTANFTVGIMWQRSAPLCWQLCWNFAGGLCWLSFNQVFDLFQVPDYFDFGTLKVKLSSLDISPNFISLGSRCGALFLFNREYGRALKA